ncbi:hypothetical protein EVAR_62126_1 [Eumeta japonica]|uniref:Uncharacterized protein n=1 Tax=Eumeta variegata TaxID=151549 RepID=A0A4C1ZXK0_EUMVA|nr:hypothetical protein EVAR_62126_1 [Eumeta japonica]
MFFIPRSALKAAGRGHCRRIGDGDQRRSAQGQREDLRPEFLDMEQIMWERKPDASQILFVIFYMKPRYLHADALYLKKYATACRRNRYIGFVKLMTGNNNWSEKRK